MQTTANLGLRKPEDTDPVAIQDFNDNADIIDREMAKKAEKTGDGSEMTARFNEASGLANLVSGEKLSTSFGKLMKAVAELTAHLADKSNPHVVTKSQVGLGSVDNTSDANKPVSTKQQAALNAKVTASGGDIANTRITNFVTSSESYPIPAANDTVGVGFGKIKKFFEDIRNTTTGACFIGQIVNNCVTNNAKQPLSAAQGKVLMDLYTKLNSDNTTLNTKLSEMTGRVFTFNNSGYIRLSESYGDRTYLQDRASGRSAILSARDVETAYGTLNGAISGVSTALDNANNANNTATLAMRHFVSVLRQDSNNNMIVCDLDPATYKASAQNATLFVAITGNTGSNVYGLYLVTIYSGVCTYKVITSSGIVDFNAINIYIANDERICLGIFFANNRSYYVSITTLDMNCILSANNW